VGRSLSMVTCVVGMVERGTCDSGGDGGGGGGGGGGCGGDDSESGEEGDEEGTGARAADGKEGRGGGRDGGGRSRGMVSGDEGRRGGGAGRGRGTSNAPVSGAGPSNEEIGGKDGSCEHANSPPGWGMQRLGETCGNSTAIAADGVKGNRGSDTVEHIVCPAVSLGSQTGNNDSTLSPPTPTPTALRPNSEAATCDGAGSDPLGSQYGSCDPKPGTC